MSTRSQGRRREPGIIVGRNPVKEALLAGVPLKEILLAEGTRGASAEIARVAKEAGVAVRAVPRVEIDHLSPRASHQGVAAMTAPFQYASLEDIILRARGRERSLVLALDHVTDPANLGAIIRAADVAGADGVVIPKDRAAPVTPAVYKTSAGAVVHLPVARVSNLVAAMTKLQEAEYWTLGASENAPGAIWDTEMPNRSVLVLGSEGRGLGRLVKESCDLVVRIPVAGAVSSLNVAQAATVLAYEWVRRGRS